MSGGATRAMDIKTFRCESCGKISTALDIEAGAGVFRRGRFYCTPCVPPASFPPAAVALGAAACLFAILLWAVFSLRARVRSAEEALKDSRRLSEASAAALRADLQGAIAALQIYQAAFERGLGNRLANLEDEDRQLRFRLEGFDRMLREAIRQAFDRLPDPSGRAEPAIPPAGPPAPAAPAKGPRPAPAPEPGAGPGVPPEGSPPEAAAPPPPDPPPPPPPGGPEASVASEGAEPLALWAERLKDKDWGIRYSAVHHLSELRDPAADPLVASALADERPAIRAHAARCLGRKQSRAGVPALIECLDDSDAYVRHCAHGALKAIAGKDLGYPEGDTHTGRKGILAAWKAWWAEAGKAAP